MTQRSRRVLFYVLVALFPVIGVIVVFYAQGWRVDFSTGHLEKVGAIFVRPYPDDASIMLDGKPVRSGAGFLSQSTLISDLLPGNYDITLKKDGYINWDERASVLPSLVTEFNNAVLIPEAPANIATGSIKDFLISSGEIISEETDGAIIWRGETIGRGVPVSASDNLGSLVFKTNNGYSLYDFSAATTTNLSALLAENGANTSGITSVIVNPADSAMIIARSAQSIWIYDASQKSVTLADRAAAGNSIGVSIAAQANDIAWMHYSPSKNISTVVLYDPFSKTLTNESTAVEGTTEELEWLGNDSLIALQSDGSLYSYDEGSEQFKKIADDVRNFSVAPDGSAIAAAENKSFEIIPVSNSETYRRFNLPDPQNIIDLFWYRDSMHVFTAYPGHVSLLDLDDLGLNNFKTVAEGSHPLYNADQNIFYTINPQGNLEQFDFPS